MKGASPASEDIAGRKLLGQRPEMGDPAGPRWAFRAQPAATRVGCQCHDEARGFSDCEHLCSDQTPRDAQSQNRGRNRREHFAVGQQSPILVRRDGDRFVLVEGLHRLEACKKLGESTIFGYLVDARKH